MCYHKQEAKVILHTLLTLMVLFDSPIRSIRIIYIDTSRPLIFSSVKLLLFQYVGFTNNYHSTVPVPSQQSSSSSLSSSSSSSSSSQNVCGVCGAVFTRRDNLLVHERRHRGIYRYACQVCGRGFSVQRDLRMHVQRKHPGLVEVVAADGEQQRKGNCAYTVRCELCCRRFSNASELAAHKAVCHPS